MNPPAVLVKTSSMIARSTPWLTTRAPRTGSPFSSTTEPVMLQMSVTGRSQFQVVKWVTSAV